MTGSYLLLTLEDLIWLWAIWGWRAMKSHSATMETHSERQDILALVHKVLRLLWIPQLWTCVSQWCFGESILGRERGCWSLFLDFCFQSVVIHLLSSCSTAPWFLFSSSCMSCIGDQHSGSGRWRGHSCAALSPWLTLGLFLLLVPTTETSRTT